MISTSDIFDSNPDKVAVCDLQFRSFGLRTAFSGPCFTVKVYEDHRLVKETFSAPGNGQVLVVDGGGSMRVGLLGDVMVGLAIRNGWAGAILNGVIRDSVALGTLEFGIKALGTTARRSGENRGGQVGVALNFGGVEFRPGWFVYADADAVLVSPVELTITDTGTAS